MPSRKGLDQALTWLRSKAADKDSLDGINAELCLHVIEDLQRQNAQKGYAIHQLKMREEEQQNQTIMELYSKEEHETD